MMNVEEIQGLLQALLAKINMPPKRIDQFFKDSPTKVNPAAGDGVLIIDTEDLDLGIPKIKKAPFSAFGGGGGGGGGDQIFFTNEVIIQPGVAEVAGKVYNSYAAFLAYLESLKGTPEYPSELNPWCVQLPSGLIEETIEYIPNVAIRGRNSRIKNMLSRFMFAPDLVSDTELLNNKIFVKDCLIEKFDFSNYITPEGTVNLPVFPLHNCVVEDTTATVQNGMGVVVAVDCMVYNLKFNSPEMINMLLARGGLLVNSQIGMSKITHCDCYGVQSSQGEFLHCQIEGLGKDKSVFGGTDKDELKFRNCTVRDALFQFNAIDAATKDRMNVDAAKTAFYKSQFECGWNDPVAGSGDGKRDNFNFKGCTFEGCNMNGGGHDITLENCSGLEGNFIQEWGGKRVVKGNIVVDPDSSVIDSNKVIERLGLFAMKMIEITYDYNDINEPADGPSKYASVILPAGTRVVEVRNIITETFNYVEGEETPVLNVKAGDSILGWFYFFEGDPASPKYGFEQKLINEALMTPETAHIALHVPGGSGGYVATQGAGVVQIFYFEQAGK